MVAANQAVSRKDWATIWTSPGANQLVLTNLAAEDLGEYSVRLRNSLGESVFVVGRVSQAAWLKAKMASEFWNSVAQSQDGRRLVVTSLSQIVASGNGGETWATLAAPGTDRTSVALGSDSGRVLLGQGNEVYTSDQPTSGHRSEDFGTTWLSWTDAANDENKELGIWRTKSLASSSDGSGILAAQENLVFWGFWTGRHPVTVGRLSLSTDGGVHWTSAALPIEPFITWTSASSSSDGRHLAAVQRDIRRGVIEVYTSRDSGASWNRGTLGRSLSAFSAVRVSGDGNTRAAVLWPKIFIQTGDSDVWKEISTPDHKWGSLCLSADGRRIYAADQTFGAASMQGAIHQSNDGGQTWRWTGSPTANWTALACFADGERVVGVSSQGIFLSPVANPATPSAVPAQIKSDLSAVHMIWQGTPHRTYHLISTPGLDGQAWQSVGAAVADGEGHVSLAEPATEAQRFWKALEVE